MRHHRQPLGRNVVLVVGLVIGVLVMHGPGDPSMDHSGVAMAPAPMPHETAGVTASMGRGHDSPAMPAQEMAMAASCAFAVLLLVDRVARRSPQPIDRWTCPTMLPSRLLVGPEPPVPKSI
ncbi:MAG: hypothetical protein GX868_08345 [Actinobacteria bacterium]|nr:hypothetical protein [Actinomycetota bacterium]